MARAASSDIGSESIAALILMRRCSSGDKYNVTFCLACIFLFQSSYPGMYIKLSSLSFGVKMLKRFDGNIVTFIHINRGERRYE